MSIDAIKYLQSVFNENHSEISGRMEDSDIERIFATVEGGAPWKIRLETPSEGGLTYEGWLGLWHKFFSLDPI